MKERCSVVVAEPEGPREEKGGGFCSSPGSPLLPSVSVAIHTFQRSGRTTKGCYSGQGMPSGSPLCFLLLLRPSDTSTTLFASMSAMVTFVGLVYSAVPYSVLCMVPW